MANISQLSNTLNFILCHRPDSVGITVDDYGWADTAAVLAALSSSGETVSMDVLRRIVTEDSRARYSFSSDESKIRATSGHSFKVNLDVTPQTPPEYLYAAVKSIRINEVKRDGLTGVTALPIELFTTPEEAKSSLKGLLTVVLKVKTGKMNDTGHVFYMTKSGSYKCSAVPSLYIEF